MCTCSRFLSNKMPMRYYVEDCPFHNECDQAAWLQMNWCESYKSKDNVRHILFRHLRSDPHHKHRTNDEIMEAVAKVEILQQEEGRRMYQDHSLRWDYDNDGTVGSPLFDRGSRTRTKRGRTPFPPSLAVSRILICSFHFSWRTFANNYFLIFAAVRKGAFGPSACVSHPR